MTQFKLCFNIYLDKVPLKNKFLIFGHLLRFKEMGWVKKFSMSTYSVKTKLMIVATVTNFIVKNTNLYNTEIMELRFICNNQSWIKKKITEFK